MIVLCADKSYLTVLQRETLASGGVNVYEVRFQFSEDWDGLQKTAVFAAGEETYSVLLSEDACIIPWEALQTGGIWLKAGVYGTREGQVVLPTIWANVGQIFCGASPGETTQPPTPTVYEQILDRIGNLDELETVSKDNLVDAINEAYNSSGTGGGDIPYKIGPGLKVVNSTLTVDTADAVEEDNTRPVTSAAVYVEIGNIEALLAAL